jgi:hypothetical protein
MSAMGIVADIAQSSAKFSDPGLQNNALNAINRQVAFDMHNFTIEFGVAFDADPKVGIGGAPSSPQAWRIGIVQNLLFEHLYYKFENGQVFEKDWRDAAIDYKEGTVATPFFGDAQRETGKLRQITVADVWLTSRGYGETTNSAGVIVDNAPSSFNMWDEPSGGCRLRLKDGSMIKRVEKVLTFQTWLIATPKPAAQGKIGGSVEVLAHVPVFSLVFWLETTKPKKPITTSLETPPYDWGMFGDAGLVDAKRINRKVTGLGSVPDVKPKAGDGGKKPVLSGVTANDRANAFLTNNGLQ